jgi:hypothetical protein
LTAAGKWSAAADSMPQLLKEQGALWERWLYVFAQVGTLQVQWPDTTMFDMFSEG